MTVNNPASEGRSGYPAMPPENPNPDAPLKFPMPWRGRLVVLAGIILVALNLRIAVAAVSPILDEMRGDLDISESLAGLLGTIPVIAFAVFGAITPGLSRRFGLEPLTVIAMIVSVLGEVARSFSPSSTSFLVFSLVALSGMGMGNVLLPPLVKRYFPDRIGVVTAIYTAALSLSTTIPPLFAIRLSAMGGWRLSLGTWSIVGLAAAVPWIFVVFRSVRARRQDKGFLGEPKSGSKQVSRHRYGGRVWRSSLSWGLAITFGINSLNSYTMFAWLPQILIDAGISASGAARYLALFSALGIPLSLIIPQVGARMRNPLPIVIACASCFAVGYIGLAVSPGLHTWVWVMFAGIGPGGFPLALALINLRTRTSAGSAALSGFTQGLGYTIAAIGPLLVGVLYDRQGTWATSWIFLVGTLIALVIGAIIACRPRMLEDTWGAKAEPPVGPANPPIAPCPED